MVSFVLVIKIRSLCGVVSLLIVGALYLIGCRSGTGATGADRQPLPTKTPPTTVPGIAAAIERESNTPGPSVSLQSATTPVVELPTARAELIPTVAPPTSAPTAEPTPAPTAPAFIQHFVQPGDTLLGIAANYGVSMAAIQLANHMGTSIDLLAGQTLAIPGTTQWLGEHIFWVVHVVKSGETLVGLASTYDLTVDNILRVNAIADRALIHVDQQLVMPVAQLVALKVPQPTATAASVAVAAAAVNAEATQTSGKSEPSSEAAPPAAAATPPTSIPPLNMPAGPADWSGYILARINQVRTEHGLNPLTLVSELSYAAQAHAEDCARRGWGSHVGSDGAVLKTRLERVGYLGQNRSENWVQARNAERAFDWWYGEIPPNDPHRRNILSPRYTEIGIGIVETGWGFIFVTDFGRR